MGNFFGEEQDYPLVGFALTLLDRWKLHPNLRFVA